MFVLSEWLESLTLDAVASFLRSSVLGVDLEETWIVCNCAAYIWNYNKHALDANRHREIIDTLQLLIDAMKKVGYSRLVNGTL